MMTFDPLLLIISAISNGSEAVNDVDSLAKSVRNSLSRTENTFRSWEDPLPSDGRKVNANLNGRRSGDATR